MSHSPNDNNNLLTNSIRSNRTHPIDIDIESLLDDSNDSNDSLTIPISIFAVDYKKQNHRWGRRRNLPQYTTEEISKHNTKDSCWIIVDSLVLDVTKFIPYHPGQIAAILKHGGTVCDEHIKYHSKNAKELCWKFVIGKVNATKPDPGDACNIFCTIM